MKLKAPGKRPRRRGRWMATIAAVVAAAGIATYWLWPEVPLVTGGTPRLVVDRTMIDLGDVSYDRFVDATFTLTNAGDGVLAIAGRPKVAATQGC